MDILKELIMMITPSITLLIMILIRFLFFRISNRKNIKGNNKYISLESTWWIISLIIMIIVLWMLWIGWNAEQYGKIIDDYGILVMSIWLIPFIIKIFLRFKKGIIKRKRDLKILELIFCSFYIVIFYFNTQDFYLLGFFTTPLVNYYIYLLILWANNRHINRVISKTFKEFT